MSLEGGDVDGEKPSRRFSDIERYLGVITIDESILSLEQIQEIEILFQRLAEYKRTKEEVTIPVLGKEDEFRDNHFVNNVTSFGLKDLRAKLQGMPPLVGQPLSDKKVVIVLGRKLGLLPRQYPDKWLYKSSSPDNLYQGEQGYISVVYNCFRVNRPDLPDNTYWHEVFAGDNFGSYINGVAITANKGFHETIDPLARLGNLIRKFTK